MNKKTIFIILAIVLASVILITGVLMLKPKGNKGVKKNEVKITLENKDDSSHEGDESVEVINEDNENKPIYSNVLVFDKEDGNISLYSKDGELVDELDLKKLYISGDVTMYESIEGNNDEISVFVKIGEEDKLSKIELNEGFVNLYDREGKVIKEVDLNEFIKPKEKEVVKEKESEDKEENKRKVKVTSERKVIEDSKNVKKLDSSSKTDVKKLEYAIDTTFKAFKTIDNKLVFKDEVRNSLVLVNEKNNKINAEVILSGIDLNGLTSVFVTEEKVYLTFEEVVEILEVTRTESGEVTEDSIMRYELEDVPSFAFEVDGILYYSVANIVGKYDTNNDTGEVLDVGDAVLDIHLTDKYLYIITEFGKDEENSVLVKANIDDLSVEGIMELKGIYSKFIGFNEDIAYIRQKDSVKEVDLKDLKPLKAFSRTGGIPIEAYKGTFYKLEDGKVKVFLIENPSKILKEFKAEGFNFHFTNN